MGAEQRLSQRKIFKRPVHILFGDGKTVLNATGIDLSIGGISLVQNVAMRVGDRCKIAFKLWLNGKEIPIQATCEVRHCIFSRDVNGIKVGMRFLEINQNELALINQFVSG